MVAVPVTLLLTAAAALGVVLLVLFLRGIRKPVLIGVHLLLGAGGLEQLVVMLRGAPSGEVVLAGRFGGLAAGLFALSMFSGLVGPLFGREWPQSANTMLAIHVAVGAAGFVLFLAWVSSL